MAKQTRTIVYRSKDGWDFKEPLGAKEKARRERNSRRQYEWNKKHKINLTLRMNLVTEADIIEWLDSQPSKHDYIAGLVRAWAAENQKKE